MSEIRISIESLGKALIYTALVVAILFAVAVGCYSAGRLQGQDASPIAAPTASQPVTVATPSPYRYVLTFTVLSTTTSNGAYEVFTTTGQHLYLQDYYTWDTVCTRGIRTPGLSPGRTARHLPLSMFI